MKTLHLAAAALLLSALDNAAALDLAIGNLRVSVPASSLKEIRYRSTLRQQYDFSCGSAALATLLTYHYGQPVSEQRVFEQMYRNGDQQKIRKQGFSLLDMKRYLASRGMRADGFRLPLQKLVDARLPAIVLVAEKGYHHFVVIKGIDGGRILVGDPSSGTRSMTRPAFESVWVGKLLFVVHGYQGPAVFNGLADWRAAPRAPLGETMPRDSLGTLTLSKHGPGDF